MRFIFRWVLFHYVPISPTEVIRPWTFLKMRWIAVKVGKQKPKGFCFRSKERERESLSLETPLLCHTNASSTKGEIGRRGEKKRIGPQGQKWGEERRRKILISPANNIIKKKCELQNMGYYYLVFFGKTILVFHGRKNTQPTRVHCTMEEAQYGRGYAQSTWILYVWHQIVHSVGTYL